MSQLQHKSTEQEEGQVANGELAQILGFLPLDSVGQLFSTLACCILEFSTDARVDDVEIKQKRQY